MSNHVCCVVTDVMSKGANAGRKSDCTWTLCAKAEEGKESSAILGRPLHRGQTQYQSGLYPKHKDWSLLTSFEALTIPVGGGWMRRPQGHVCTSQCNMVAVEGKTCCTHLGNGAVDVLIVLL